MNQSAERASLIVALCLTYFVVVTNATAVSPPPDAAYPGGNAPQTVLNDK